MMYKLGKLPLAMIVLVPVLMLTACSGNKPEVGTVIVPAQFTCPAETHAHTDSRRSSGVLNNSEFVYLAYATVLNRQPDMAGFKNACIAIRTGAVTRPQLIKNMVNSPEFKKDLSRSQFSRKQ